MRIAMWSGPRNISTAMMRSWENRDDTCVVDEPFYACYLQQTGLKHPGWESVLESQSTEWNNVASMLRHGPMEAPIYYQKHMTHHMVEGVDLTWAEDMVHVFLIRSPEEVVASYRRTIPYLSAEDIGIVRQGELYQELRELTGQDIPVVDAADVLKDPAGMLRKLCEALGIEFSDKMLNWPAGPRPTDGVWAPHWYGNVETSTGFMPFTDFTDQLENKYLPIVDECRPAYETLYDQRMV